MSGPLLKLRLVAAVVAYGIPTTVEAGIEYERYPGAVALSVLLLGAGASWAGLMATRDAAEETAALKARAAVPDPARPDTDTDALIRAAAEAAYIEGAAAGHGHGYQEGYEAGYIRALVPSTARHGTATTGVGMAPAADTAVMDAVGEQSVEQLAAQAAEDAEAADPWAGWEGWFAAITDGRGGRAAA